MKNSKAGWFYLNKGCLDCLPFSPKSKPIATTNEAQWELVGAGWERTVLSCPSLIRDIWRNTNQSYHWWSHRSDFQDFFCLTFLKWVTSRGITFSTVFYTHKNWSSCEIFRSGTFFWCKAPVHKMEQGYSRNVVSTCCLQALLGIVVLNFPLPHRPKLAGAMGQANCQKKMISSLFSSYFRKPHKQMRFQRTTELARRFLENL